LVCLLPFGEVCLRVSQFSTAFLTSRFSSGLYNFGQFHLETYCGMNGVNQTAVSPLSGHEIWGFSELEVILAGT
jgi:hypothetical protein